MAASECEADGRAGEGRFTYARLCLSYDGSKFFRFKMSSSSTTNFIRPWHNARPIGVSKHDEKFEWSCALAFSNIGLAGKAFVGRQWFKQHDGRLEEIFTNLLTAKEKPQGILLCEVGNFTEPIPELGRIRLKHVLKKAFQNAGAAEHGPPQFFLERRRNYGSF